MKIPSVQRLSAHLRPFALDPEHSARPHVALILLGPRLEHRPGLLPDLARRRPPGTDDETGRKEGHPHGAHRPPRLVLALGHL